MTDSFEITVPGEAGFIATLRLFVAGVARRGGLDEQKIADLKLAVSEVVTAALLDGAATVTIAAESDERSLRIRLPAPTARRLPASAEQPGGDFDPLSIAAALVDESRLEGTELVLTVGLSGTPDARR